MHRVVEWVMGVALVMGGPGLFLIAFLDSSFLSFPQVVDLLMMGLVTHHKERLLYYALMPTLGSLGGCLVLYFIARKGGETFLRRRAALDSYVRLTTARQILDRLRPRLDIPAGRVRDEERLLEEIVAEFRAR